MGRRRLSPAAVASLISVSFLGVVLSACGGSGDKPAPTPTATVTVTSTPSATPTPDPLGPQPADAASARTALERYLAGHSSLCDEAIVQRWRATCANGDIDGDGTPDSALLVPLSSQALRASNPATIFVQRSGGSGLEQFPASGVEADVSTAGQSLFGLVERTGDSRADLVYLVQVCNSRSCNTRVEIQAWDGNAWRNAGPSDAGIDNLETVEFSGEGAASKLTLRGGHLASLDDGPTRARTVVYTFDGTRYAASAVTVDPPEYLYHAIVDADALFARRDYDGAIAAYRAAINNSALKDWKLEEEGVDGREALTAYALFRIALATAAQGRSPTAALDDVITNGREEIFQYAAEAFRTGYQEGGNPHQGCLRVTSYLATPPIPDRLLQMFNYGTANFPIKTSRDICEL